MRRILIIILLVWIVPWGAVGQRNDFVARGELIFVGGGMTYTGDLNNQTLLSIPRLAYGVGIRERIDNRWALRFMIGKGEIGAEQDYNELRNLSFQSNIYEGTAVVEFDFRPYGVGATEAWWTPYMYGGIGAFYFNPMARVGAEGELVELQPLCTEGQGTTLYPERLPYTRIQWSLPFGVGIRMKLGKTFTVTAEYGFRKTWTDYLDDVSKTYVGAELLTAEVKEGELASRMADRSSEVREGYVNEVGIKRGDDSLNDWYSFVHVGIGVSLETMFGWMRGNKCRN